MTTWSALGIRWTFMSSARSRARLISTFANALWPLFRCRSAMNNGCSENFAPQAMTVATRLIGDARDARGPEESKKEGCTSNPKRAFSHRHDT